MYHLPVTTATGLRSYIGVPLYFNDGTLYGTLCGIDSSPKQLSSRSHIVEMMSVFGRLIVFQLEREQMLSAIKEAAEAKSNFFSSVSHELRTPLTCIIGFHDLLVGGVYGKLDEGQAKPISQIGRNGRNLLELINDVLDLAKVEGGHLELALSKIKLNEIVTNVLQGLEPQTIAREVQLVVDLANSPTSVVQVDEQRFGQILLNLLSNALKFSQRSIISVKASQTLRLDASVKLETDDLRFEGLPWIWAKPKTFEKILARDGWSSDNQNLPDTGWLALSINDAGSGIEPDQQSRIFEEFQQANNAATRKAGITGLGLAIVSKLITLMHGYLAVRSQPGIGSSFTLFLPIPKDI